MKKSLEELLNEPIAVPINNPIKGGPTEVKLLPRDIINLAAELLKAIVETKTERGNSILKL